MNTIVGIYIGAENVKVAVYNLAGQLVFFTSRQNIVHHPRYGFSEYNAEEIWEGVKSCLKEASSNPVSGFICSIGITSFGESSVLVDRSGKPCCPVIAWYDQRAVQQTYEIERRIDKRILYDITGQILSPKFGICKLLWIKENAPEAFQRAYKCLSMQDYIIYKLTGEFVTDYSLASRMLCFDIKTLQWSHDIMDLVGIKYDLMPEVRPGGAKSGILSKEAGGATGLQQGIPVFTGGHDHACAAVAVNILEDGTMLDSMGAAETTIIADDKILPADIGYENALCVYPHFGRKLYRIITSIQASSSVFEWFNSAFGASYPEAVPEGTSIHEKLLMEAEQASANTGLIFLPFIRGLQENPLTKGTFIGIDDTCDRSSFIRAISEGICFELRRRITSCEHAIGTHYDTLRAVGDLAASVLHMDLKSSITGKQIEIPDCSEASCYGAALLSAIGAGIYEESELSSLYHTKTVYLPSMANTSAYDRKYRSYLEAYNILSGLYSRQG